jgi:hypothetical protein
MLKSCPLLSRPKGPCCRRVGKRSPRRRSSWGGPLLEITSGYAKRAAGQLPQQGTEGLWRTNMAYRTDHKMLREGPVDDDHLRFTISPPVGKPEPALIA